MAGSVRAVWSRAAASFVAAACAQAQPLSDDSLPNDTNTPITTGSGGASSVASGGTPASATGGVPGVPNGGAPQAGTGGASTTPSTGGAALGTGGTPPGTGGSPFANGGTTPTSTGGAPPAGTGGSADFNRCVALTVDNACTRCVCGGPCQAQSLACGASSDTARNASCTAIVECGMAQHCTSVACYCGAADPATTCQTAPAGPCIAPIQAAAGSSDFNAVANALVDTTHAVNLANAVGECAKSNCAGTCGL